MAGSDFKFTAAQKDVLLRNLDIEVQARIEKLQSQSILAGRSLRERIEMRINRVPKRNWNVTLRSMNIGGGGIKKPPSTKVQVQVKEEKKATERKTRLASARQRQQQGRRGEQQVLSKTASTRKMPRVSASTR